MREQLPQAVVAFTFGRAAHPYSSGLSNDTMARRVEQYTWDRSLPFCVQGEVGDGILDKANGYIAARSQDKHGKGYIGTREAAVQMVENFFRPRGVTQVYLVAHRHHAWRVVRVLQKLGVNVVGTDTESIPYDPHSSQTWCRSAWRFIPYEIRARLIYLKRGWI